VSQTNNAAIEDRVVIDEEFQTALEVLIALREKLKDNMKLYIQRVPINATWCTEVHDMERQFREDLSHIRCMQLRLKHWASLRLKTARRTIGN
jgi:hypothetical protein